MTIKTLVYVLFQTQGHTEDSNETKWVEKKKKRHAYGKGTSREEEGL